MYFKDNAILKIIIIFLTSDNKISWHIYE